MKISIIVPVYNVQDYLERCIKSLINQTYKNIEIILVNDGSTDNSLEICNNYCNKDDRIIVINKENGGLSDARNYGICNATGDYILFVDSDDYIELDSCEKFESIVKNNIMIDVVTSNAKVVDNNEISYLKHTCYSKYNFSNGIDYLSHEIKNNSMSMASVLNLYNLKFIKDNNLYFKKGILHEDEEFTPRVFLKSKNIIHLDYCFYNYILRNDSISRRCDLSLNAKHLFNTLYDLEKLYIENVSGENQKILRNSLSEKYLYMSQSLYDTGSKIEEKFDLNFLKRNAYTTVCKFKVFLFCLSSIFYFNLNSLKKNIVKDMKECFSKKNIFFTGLIFVNVLFLSRFFTLARNNNDLWYSIFILASRFVLIIDLIFYLKYLYNNKSINFFNVGVIVYHIIILIINFVDNGSMRSVISSTYPIIALSMLLEMTFKSRYRLTYTILNYTFLFLITTNILQMIFFKGIFGEHLYFLGPRNQLGIVGLITLFLTYLYSHNNRNFIFFYYTLAVCFLMTFIGNSINNLIAFIFIVLYLFLKKYNMNKYIDRLSSNSLFFSYIIIFISIVLLRIQNIFSFFIENVFKRSLSLSGRTFLWDEAIRKIKLKPLLGYGRGIDTNYFSIEYFTNPDGTIKSLSAHNTFLQNVYEFGLFPITFFLIFLGYILRRIKQYNYNEMNILYIILFSLLLVYMVEAIPFDGLFFIIGVAYFYCYYKKEKEQNI